MRNVQILVIATLAALCFVLFVAKVRPLDAAFSPSSPVDCIMASYATPGCDSEGRWSHFKRGSSSRSISELPSVVSAGPIVERKHAT